MTRILAACAVFALGFLAGHQLPYRLWQWRLAPDEPMGISGTYTGHDGSEWSYFTTDLPPSDTYIGSLMRKGMDDA